MWVNGEMKIWDKRTVVSGEGKREGGKREAEKWGRIKKMGCKAGRIGERRKEVITELRSGSDVVKQI